jgi:hypothetical protein
MTLAIITIQNWPRIRVKVRLEDVGKDCAGDYTFTNGIAVYVTNRRVGQTKVNAIEVKMSNGSYYLWMSENNSNLHDPFKGKETRRYHVNIENLKRAIARMTNSQGTITGIRVTHSLTKVYKIGIPDNVKKEYANCILVKH